MELEDLTYFKTMLNQYCLGNIYCSSVIFKRFFPVCGFAFPTDDTPAIHRQSNLLPKYACL